MTDQESSTERRRSWSSHFVTSKQEDYKPYNAPAPPPPAKMQLYDSHFSLKHEDVSLFCMKVIFTNYNTFINILRIINLFILNFNSIFSVIE